MAIKKVIEIDIKANSKEADEALKGINGDLKTIEDQSKKTFSGDGAKKITEELKKTGQAATSVKTRLRELEDEMSNIGDVGSPQFQKLAKEAGVLKDKMNNAKAAIKSMSSDFPRLQVGTQAFQAIGGAAQGAMGAMALFGSENEEVQKSIQKLVAIQSVLNAVTTVSNALSDETALGLKVRTVLAKRHAVATWAQAISQKALAIATGTATGAMKLLRLALIATGIGAIVVGVVALAMNFRKVSGFVKNLYKRMGVLGKIMKYTLLTVMWPFVLAIKAVMYALEALGITESKEEKASAAAHKKKIKRIDEQLKKKRDAAKELEKQHNEEQENLEKIIELADAEGKSTVELTKQKIKGSIEYQKSQLEEIKNGGKVLELMIKTLQGQDALVKIYTEALDRQKAFLAEREKMIEDSERKLVINDIKAKQAGAAAHKDALSKQLTEERRIEDLRNNAIKDKQDRDIAIRKTQFARNLEDLRANGIVSNEEIKLLEAELQRDLIAIAKEAMPEKLEVKKLELDLIKTTNNQILTSEQDLADRKKKIQDEAEEYKRARTKQTAEQSVDVAMQGFQAVADLAAAFAGTSEKSRRRAFNIQKAANIAQATIETYKNATAAYGSFASIPVVGVPLGIAAAAAAVAAGVANIKNISSTQFEGGGGGTPAVPAGVSVGGGGNTAQFNVVGNTGVNQLAESLGGEQVVKAFVVSGDVTTAQSLDRNKVDTATI